jgi:hypothetical protein
MEADGGRKFTARFRYSTVEFNIRQCDGLMKVVGRSQKGELGGPENS